MAHGAAGGGRASQTPESRPLKGRLFRISMSGKVWLLSFERKLAVTEGFEPSIRLYTV
jgi:hypothetical protein